MADQVAELIAAWHAELPDLLGDNAELIKRLMVLGDTLGVATRRVLPEFGLTSGEFGVLVGLRRGGAPYRVRSNELSRALLLSTGGVSNVVNRLAARGLVVRETDERDGRGSFVRLTDAGAELAERSVRASNASHEAVFAGVPAEVTEAAVVALRALCAAVEPVVTPAG